MSKYILDITEDEKDIDHIKRIGEKKDLQQYLRKKYKLHHNMVFVQGLFLACKAERLYQKCVDIAKRIKNKPVTFFEKNVSETGNADKHIHPHPNQPQAHTPFPPTHAYIFCFLSPLIFALTMP